MKIMKKSVFASVSALTMLLAINASGAPEGANSNQSRGRERTESSDSRRRETNTTNSTALRAQAEAQLKEKYPEEYAEIEKMRKEANAKLQALAEKGGITLPLTYAEQVEILKEKYPTEMKEIEALQESDRMGAMVKLRELAQKEGMELSFAAGGRQGGREGGMGGGREGGRESGMNNREGGRQGGREGGRESGMNNREGGREGGREGNSDSSASTPQRRNTMQETLRELKEKYPTEMEEAEALRTSDSSAYRKKLQELINRLKADKAAEAKTETSDK